MGKVIDFSGDYTQPSHVAADDLFGCSECDSFTFLIRTGGEIVCSACGTVKTSVQATGPDVFIEVKEGQ